MVATAVYEHLPHLPGKIHLADTDEQELLSEGWSMESMTTTSTGLVETILLPRDSSRAVLRQLIPLGPESQKGRTEPVRPPIHAFVCHCHPSSGAVLNLRAYTPAHHSSSAKDPRTQH